MFILCIHIKIIYINIKVNKEKISEILGEKKLLEIMLREELNNHLEELTLIVNMRR